MAGFGENFKSYPLRVTVIRAYDNDLDFVPYQGRYDLTEIKNKDGVKQKRRLLARTGRFGQYFQLPWPSGKAQHLGQATNRITYLQIDVNTFYPVTFTKGVLSAEIEEPALEPVVVPLVNEKGEPVTDEQGRAKMRYELDENGQPVFKKVLNDKGEPVMTKREVPLINPGFYYKDGKMYPIPYAVANNVGSIVEWLNSEVMDARREERPKNQSLMDLIKDFGPWIALIIVAIFGGQAIMSFGASLQQATSINAESARLIANATQLMAYAMMKQGMPVPPLV